jgi:hypothetical protein
VENMEAIFETNPIFLSSLLGDIKTGKIQLPDFQRDGFGKTNGYASYWPQSRAPSQSERS